MSHTVGHKLPTALSDAVLLVLDLEVKFDSRLRV